MPGLGRLALDQGARNGKTLQNHDNGAGEKNFYCCKEETGRAGKTSIVSMGKLRRRMVCGLTPATCERPVTHS